MVYFDEQPTAKAAKKQTGASLNLPRRIHCSRRCCRREANYAFLACLYDFTTTAAIITDLARVVLRVPRVWLDGDRVV